VSANIYGTPSVQITVLDVLAEGEPPCGYRKGDSWMITDYAAPQGLCTWAITAMAPFLMAMRFGGELPWEEDKDRAVACCPDAANPVVFELRRLPAGDLEGSK